MDFSTNDCAWSQITLTLLGRKLTGLRGFEFKKTVEKEHIYATSNEPVDIQEGNKKYEGNLKVLKHEVDKLNDAALLAGFTDITEVPHTLMAITVEYKKAIGGERRLITVPGVSFTELGVAMEQGAKMSEVTLPFLAMRILHTKA